MGIGVKNSKLLNLILIAMFLSGCSSTTITKHVATQNETKVVNTLTPIPIWTSIVRSLTPTEIITPTSTEMTPTKTVIPRAPVAQLTFVSHPNDEKSEVYAVDIYCYKPETICLGEPKLLFEWNDWISGIDWSPDEKKIAYSSGLYIGELYIADWNGKNPIHVTNRCGDELWPKWSPDGTKVAFIFNEGNNNCEYISDVKINIYEPITNRQSVIISNAYSPIRVDWLSDGKLAYIANNSTIDRVQTIYIVDLNGIVINELPTNAADYTHLLGMTFSPNGKQVAFVGDIWPKTGRETIDIYVTDVEGGKVSNITDGLGTNFSPDWSPNTNWIAFDSDRTGIWEIYIVKPDGTGLMQITRDNEPNTDPAWRALP